jgi:N-methylhydantoinase A
MRYVGQSHEISVEISEEQQKKIVAQSISGFEHIHDESFGYKMRGRDVEWVTARVIAESSSGQFRPLIHSVNEIAQPIDKRSVLIGAGSRVAADVYRRWELGTGQVLKGPSIIEQLDTTTYVGQGWSATQEKDGVLWMRRKKK